VNRRRPAARVSSERSASTTIASMPLNKRNSRSPDSLDLSPRVRTAPTRLHYTDWVHLKNVPPEPPAILLPDVYLPVEVSGLG
jgi:hypothetical protein